MLHCYKWYTLIIITLGSINGLLNELPIPISAPVQYSEHSPVDKVLEYIQVNYSLKISLNELIGKVAFFFK